MTEPDRTRPLALLIPGLDGTGRFYHMHVAGLATRYRVCPWEFRARGQFGFEDLVAELAEGTSGEKAGSISVVGESFGGPVAMHFVLAHADRVRSLTLINSFAVYHRQTRISLACLLVPMLRWPVIRAIKNALADRVLAIEGVPVERRRHYHETVRLIDETAYRRRLELVRSVNLTDRLSHIRVPTLILASGRDKVVPSISEGRFMASRIPNARLHVFPRAGHALLLTPGFSLASYL